MKTFLLLLISILLTNYLMAQNEIKKHELSLNILANEYNLDIPSEYRTLEFIYFNGFQYKYGFNKFIIRGSFVFNKKEDIIYPNNYFLISLSDKSQFYDIRFGIEKVLLKKKLFKLFGFSDLVYRNQNGITQFTGVSDLDGKYYEGIYKYQNHRFGLSVGAGAKFNITENVYLNLETCFAATIPLFTGDFHPQLNYFLNPIKTLALGVSF